MRLKNIFFVLLAMTLSFSAYAGKVYTIYPIPQKQTAIDGTSSFTSQVNIIADPGIDQVTIERAIQILTEHGLKATVREKPTRNTSTLYLGIASSQGPSNRFAKGIASDWTVLSKEGKYDRHILTLTSGNRGIANVMILGEHTDATFYGLASLEQILDNGTQKLQNVRIDDYADIQYRGIIEGFYGVPYSEEVKKDLFRFMARYKMNSYMYGAKSDPYHSHKWGEPYPEEITPEQKEIGYLTQEMLSNIVEVSHQCKVNFIWAIHPGQAFTDVHNNEVIDQIMEKFELMYDLGVRQFGLFVDDVGVPTDEPTLKLNAERLKEVQTLVEEKWNRTYNSPADTVKPVNFVPQLYAYSWEPAETRELFYGALSETPEHTVVYITGANIWSVPNSHDLSVIKQDLGRNVAWWWNYPCNDNDMTKLFVRDTYTNFKDEKWIADDATLPGNLSGASALISNPMQQGEASKIALFGVADYAWNHGGFDNISNYNAAVEAVVGVDRAEAFAYLSQYLTYFDSEPLASMTEQYKKDGDSKALKAEMRKILDSCNILEDMRLSQSESDSLFYADIRPWINKLSDMAFLTTLILDEIDQPAADEVIRAKLKQTALKLEDNPLYHFSVLTGMGEDIKLEDKTAEPAATVLKPFIDYLATKL